MNQINNQPVNVNQLYIYLAIKHKFRISVVEGINLAILQMCAFFPF